MISVCGLQPTTAQVTVATDPVGFTTTSLLANSDTYVSIPFTRQPEFVAGISSAATSGTTGIITVGGNPWTANQFVYGGTQHNHYYALIGPISGTGTKEGHTYSIVGNGTGTLTVSTSNDDSSNLNTIPANTRVQVIPYWTPATIFPASDANVSFTPTTSPPTYKTLLQVPDYSAPTYNAPYAAQYYFDGNSSSWHRINGKSGDGGVGDDDPLLPDGYFVVHNGNKAPTRLLPNLGAVLLRKMSTPLATATNRTQGNPIGMVRPVDVALNATGLGPANGSFVAGDQLLVFNNAQAAFKKSPATYFSDTSVVTVEAGGCWGIRRQRQTAGPYHPEGNRSRLTKSPDLQRAVRALDQRLSGTSDWRCFNKNPWDWNGGSNVEICLYRSRERRPFGRRNCGQSED